MTKHTFFHAGRIAADVLANDLTIEATDRQHRRINKRARRLSGVTFLPTLDRADVIVVTP